MKTLYNNLAVLILVTAALVPVADARPYEDFGMEKVGEGRFSWFGISLYSAGLWTGKVATADGLAEPSALLSLRYEKNIRKEYILKITGEEWSRLSVGSSEQQQGWLQELSGILPDVSKGDSLSSLVTASGSTRFYLDSKPIGLIEDPEFGRAFLAIWLHPETRGSKLRRKLLGEYQGFDSLFQNQQSSLQKEES